MSSIGRRLSAAPRAASASPNTIPKKIARAGRDTNDCVETRDPDDAQHRLQVEKTGDGTHRRDAGPIQASHTRTGPSIVRQYCKTARHEAELDRSGMAKVIGRQDSSSRIRGPNELNIFEEDAKTAPQHRESTRSFRHHHPSRSFKAEHSQRPSIIGMW